MNEQSLAHSALQQFPFWDNLTPDQQALILDRHYTASFSPGQVVCGESKNCLGMVWVLRGVLRTYLLSPEGKEITLYRARDNECCIMAAACALHSISFETHVEAEKECQAIVIPIDVYSCLLKDNIYVKAISYEMAMERFSDIVAGLERLVFLSLEQRLASFLLQESSQTNTNHLQMTHEQIATSIGSAREAVSRTLKKMASRGWIELHRGGIELTGKPQLYDLIK